MRIAIIGAGFTGLAAALSLVEKNHEVEIFEKEAVPGGLAIGFKKKGWKWPLEKHYHHIFTSDKAIRELAGKVGHDIIFKETTSSVFVEGESHKLDSPLNLLRFSRLDLISRLRVGIILFIFKMTTFWKPLEKTTSESYLKFWMGEKAWKILWEPLFERKFGKYYKNIPASWFWARIKKRSKYLGYPVGGFESLAKSIEKVVMRKGGKFHYSTSIDQIKRSRDRLLLNTDSGKQIYFDRVICTLPGPLFTKITPGLPPSYSKKLLSLMGLGAVNLVLALNHRFLDKTYWLNVNARDFPFLGVMEQTNFMSSKYYSKERIIYVGNYLDPDHPYFQKTAKELVREFTPYLRQINTGFRKNWIRQAYVFKAPFAQPIITLNYSRKLPKLKTPVKGLYLANIQQVYPWDRGTNYAVELGEKVAELID